MIDTARGHGLSALDTPASVAVSIR